MLAQALEPAAGRARLALLAGLGGEPDAVVRRLGEQRYLLEVPGLDEIEPGRGPDRIDHVGAERHVVMLGGDVGGGSLRAEGGDAELLGDFVGGEIDRPVKEARGGTGRL